MNFTDLIEAKFDFAGIGAWFADIYGQITANANFAGVIEMLDSYIKLLPAFVVAAILIALSLVQVFCGKKLLGLQKFLACFVVGFACGVAFLEPLVAELGVAIPAVIIGLVVGIVAALLCKPIYFLAYIIAAGYSVYMICMGGYYLPEEVLSFTKGNWVMALIPAVIAIVLALILRKTIERLGTAILGAWTLYLSVDALLLALLGSGFAGLVGEAAVATVELIVIAVFALIGFIVQVKTRKRY